jgi:CBS domain-containing protein
MPHFRSDPSLSDILEAMRAQGSFMDITPDDAEELFRVAHRMAVKRLRRSVLVRDLMTRQPITLVPEMEVRQAARLLADAGVSGAPVVRGDEIVGVVSVKDFLSLMGLRGSVPPIALAAAMLDSTACDAVGLGTVAVATIMSAPAVTIEPEATAGEAAQIMSRLSISRLPVSVEGHLEGIVSITDLMRAFGDMLGEES